MTKHNTFCKNLYIYAMQAVCTKYDMDSNIACLFLAQV